MSAHSAAIIVLSSTVEILLFLGHQLIRAQLLIYPQFFGSFFSVCALVSIVLTFIYHPKSRKRMTKLLNFSGQNTRSSVVTL